MLLNALGFPDTNFDPNMGDTLKVSYYAFFIAVSFVFLLCEIFKKYPKLISIISIVLIICFMFLLGFPKTDYSSINENLDSKIELSVFCNPLSIVFSNTSPTDCQNVVKIAVNIICIQITLKIFSLNQFQMVLLRFIERIRSLERLFKRRNSKIYK